MKINWKHIYMLLTIGLLTACEIIPEDERIVDVFTPVTIKRTSLLIEYSGWMCVNCPTAAEVAHQLKEQYGENLVVVVMHPESNPNTRYGSNQNINYTCPEADSIYIKMGGTNTTAFPTGNINMFKNDGKSYFTEYSSWGNYISKSYSTPKFVLIGQQVKGSADYMDIDIQIDITNMSTDVLDATLQVWLTEDNVIGSQKKPEGTDKEYAHNHLMRASISPIWGDAVRIDAQQKEQVSYQYTLPEKVKKENCNIVAVVSVDGEVVQANETKITLNNN